MIDQKELPQGWKMAKLGDVMPLSYGKGLVVGARNKNGNVPVYGSNGIVGYHSQSLTQGGCIVVGRKGSAGAVHFSLGPCWVIDTAYYAEGSSNTILRYFYYLLQAQSLVALDQSTAIPSLSRDAYNAIEVPIPPASEQYRIVAKIEELFSDLDAGVAALKRAKANLKRYRAAVLKEAIEGKLTEQWRADHPNVEAASVLLDRILKERRTVWEAEQLSAYEAKGKTPPQNWQDKYKESVRPNLETLPELPRGWCWATVQQAGDVQLGRQRAPRYHQGLNMRPYLRVANVFEDRIDLADVKEMNFDDADYEAYKLNYGDILLNEGQSMELIGRAAMYRDEIPGACFTNTLVRFRAYQHVDREYALKVFLAYLHSGRFQSVATITVNIAHLGAKRFSEMEFPLPPLPEQVEIAREVERRESVIRASIGLIDAALRRSARLRASILKQAFEGKLVPQGPNDAPAVALPSQDQPKPEASGIDSVRDTKTTPKRQMKMAFTPDKE